MRSIIRLASMCVCASLCLAVELHPQASDSKLLRKDPVMTRHAEGTFDVKNTPLPPDDATTGTRIGRFGLDKQFHGDLEASSKGEMLASGNPASGTAGYVAIEHICPEPSRVPHRLLRPPASGHHGAGQIPSHRHRSPRLRHRRSNRHRGIHDHNHRRRQALLHLRLHPARKPPRNKKREKLCPRSSQHYRVILSAWDRYKASASSPERASAALQAVCRARQVPLP